MRTYLRFNNLGKLIRDSGFDLRYVAGVCGIAQSSLTRYCRGDCIPKMDVGLKLCEAIGASFYDIWGKPYEEVRKRFFVPGRIGYAIESRYHNNLEYFRKEKGWSVDYIAFRCGINRRTMLRYLKKESIPNVADGLVMATALDSSVYQLFETEFVNV